MRIEKGKTYVDENGKKAGPLIGGPFKYIAGRGGADDPEWENDGTVRIEGEESYGNLVAEWAEGPIVTETVQRTKPGVYGPLKVGAEISIPDCDRPDQPPPREIEAYLTKSCLDASDWRELARVALEIAEYLDAQ